MDGDRRWQYLVKLQAGVEGHREDDIDHSATAIRTVGELVATRSVWASVAWLGACVNACCRNPDAR